MQKRSRTLWNLSLLKIVSFISLSAFCISDCALAQKIPEVESTLVTGVYSPLESSDVAGTVTVLGLEEIQALSARSLSDLLRTVPGVQVEELGGPGGLAAVSIRGGESNFTLVLLDGVAINDPTNTRGGVLISRDSIRPQLNGLK